MATRTVPALRAARPHLIRAAIAAVVAIGGMIASSFGQFKGKPKPPASEQALALVGAGILLLGGLAAVRALSSGFKKATSDGGAERRGASISLIIQAVGYFVVVVSVLQVLEQPVQGLLLGGALTGVILGLAAQQVLANFFAGLVLAVVRPFAVGDHVILRSGPLGGEYEGAVADMNLFYVRLLTDRGPVDLPNAGVLSAAVGPGARSADDPDGGPEPVE